MRPTSKPLSRAVGAIQQPYSRDEEAEAAANSCTRFLAKARGSYAGAKYAGGISSLTSNRMLITPPPIHSRFWRSAACTMHARLTVPLSVTQ